MVKLSDIIEDPIAAALETAAALVEDGWCKGDEHTLSPTGKHLFCAVGAILLVLRSPRV